MTDQVTETTEVESLGEYYSYYIRLTDGVSKRVQKAFFEAEDGDDIKNNIGNRYFDNIDPKYRSELIVFRNYLRNAYFSVVSVHSVISDVEMCARMINRYPWHGTDISKGDHFAFVWSSFANHCYIFEERTKQLGKHLNELSANFGGDKIKVGPWVKLIKKEVGEHIAFRGAHIHEWSRNYEGYELFKAVDFLAPFDQKYKWAQKHLYRETKLNLKSEILDSREKMLKILSGLEPDPIAHVLKYCAAFDTLLEKHEV